MYYQKLNTSNQMNILMNILFQENGSKTRHYFSELAKQFFK